MATGHATATERTCSLQIGASQKRDNTAVLEYAEWMARLLPNDSRLADLIKTLRIAVLRMAAVIAIWAACNVSALAEDADKEDSATKQTAPTMYLDLRTTYARVPAGTLSIGMENTALFTALQSLALSNGTISGLPANLSLPASQAVTVDLPMTVDVSDRVSLYAGVSTSSTSTPLTGWSSLAVSSWNVGFQADVYKQNGGSIPTVTWQSTITEAVPNGPLATTTFNNILEFDYAFDKDETRGLLAGVQDTRAEIGSPLARIHPNLIGYLGGYYQWQNNWKFTGRVGVQSFGGAELLNLAPVQLSPNRSSGWILTGWTTMTTVCSE